MNEILGALVQQRITDLLHDRRWYRRQPSPAHWFGLAQDTDRELRILLRLRREARLQEAALPDPVTEAKRYDEWTSGEMVVGFGR